MSEEVNSKCRPILSSFNSYTNPDSRNAQRQMDRQMTVCMMATADHIV